MPQLDVSRNAFVIPERSIAKQCADRNGRHGLWGKRPLNQPLGYGQVGIPAAKPKPVMRTKTSI